MYIYTYYITFDICKTGIKILYPIPPPKKKTKEKEQVGKLYPVLTVNAIC